jgi:hypothetical protein
MRYLYSIILLIVVLTAPMASACAQASLSLRTISTSSATPTLNSQLSIFTKLKNESATDTFHGPINFLLANKDSIIYNINIVGKPAIAGTTITLAPHDSVNCLFTVQLLTSNFMAGPDIIIVWPVAAVQIIDSARAPINISIAAGITPTAAEGITAYVANDQLYIRDFDGQSILMQVRIYNLVGQLVADPQLTDSSAVVSLQTLPHGAYIADIISGTGLSRRIKFVR